MVKHGLLAVSLLFGAAACEKKDAPPTPAERREAATAQTQKAEAERAKERADNAVEAAKQRQETAEERLDKAEDRAEEAKDKVAMDWKGPPDGWATDWLDFAVGKERIIEKHDYVIERDADGSILAYRKVKHVAGGAYDGLKDAALVTEVKAKLAADDDTRAHKIDVDADDHKITLKGNVANGREAGEAVRLALSTPGVERVVSRLDWNKKE